SGTSSSCRAAEVICRSNVFMLVSANRNRVRSVDIRRECWRGQAVAVTYPPMCNLYSLNKKRDAVARFFRVSHNRAAYGLRDLPAPCRAGSPADTGRGREIVTMSWGFMLLQNGKP